MRQSSIVVPCENPAKINKKWRKLSAILIASSGLGFAIMLTPPALSTANAQNVVQVPRACSNGLCGSTEYWGGRVRIRVSGSSVSRHTHYNFRTNPGAQIEIRNRPLTYSFEQRPRRTGTYSVQSCERGGIGARSTCGRWVTFRWRS